MTKEDVFLRRTKPPKKKGLNVAMLMGKERVQGQVGLEIEVEGISFPKTSPWIVEYDKKGKFTNEGKRINIPKQWRYTKDHSLRGRDNAEYVLREPIMFDEVPQALKDLWNMFDECNSQLDESNRTSVHVHVNVQEWHINRVTSFMTMYYVLEEILTQWCGEHRVGNLFCLSLKDAPGILEQVQAFIQTDGKVPPQENLHYAGLSFYAIQKFGSLEFRTLRGVNDPRVIEGWVKIIRRLYDLSAEYTDPRTLVEQFSEQGPLGWFENILGDTVVIVRTGLPSLTDDTIRNSMYENIRIAQDLCYCRDWDLFDPLDIRPDPFGRSSEYVVNQLNNAEEPVHDHYSMDEPQLTTAGIPSSWVSQAFSTSYNSPPPLPISPVEQVETWIDDFDD